MNLLHFHSIYVFRLAVLAVGRHFMKFPLNNQRAPKDHPEHNPQEQIEEEHR